jgi:hypothetical protein
MSITPRRIRRRETIAIIAECAAVLGGVLAFMIVFMAMLGFAQVSTAVWFAIGAVPASCIARAFNSDRVPYKKDIRGANDAARLG